jgi:acetyl esterase/lipase
MLDVYAPTQGKTLPIVVWIHGGGFSAGDKKEVHHKPQALVEKGFVFVSINYRFVPKVTVKQIAGDAAKALRWVHDHAKDYGGDPQRLIVMGHSAGATLAALVCTDESYLKAEGLSFALIKGCVAVDGRFAVGKGQDVVSPATHVGKGKHLPPFLLLYVSEQGQSPAFAKLLQAAGISAKAFHAEGKTHASINEDLGRAGDRPTQELFEFLAVVLKK